MDSFASKTPESEIRQGIFDILVSEWCGKATPLAGGPLHSSLQQLRFLRFKFASNIFPGTGNASATPESTLPMDAVSKLYKDKLIALTFWYEVAPRVTCLAYNCSPVSL